LVFPQRASSSLEDDLKQEAQQLSELKPIGALRIVGSWDDILNDRPFDTPFFTGLKDRGCILIHLGSANVPDPTVVEEIIASRRRWGLQWATFLGGSYPVIRCTLEFPDNPMDPFILEAGLDIRDGDVQAFCQGALSDPCLDVILKHEEMAEGCWALAYRTPQLAALVRQEVRLAIDNLAPGATKSDFDASVKRMEETFPSPGDGIDLSKCVILAFEGEAKHRFITY
jgi:hypothetical protein